MIEQTQDDNNTTTWQTKTRQALEFAVAHLEDDDRARRSAQGVGVKAHIEGCMVRFTWGTDETGEPLDLMLVESAALFDGAPLPEPTLIDAPDTVREDWATE